MDPIAGTILALLHGVRGRLNTLLNHNPANASIGVAFAACHNITSTNPGRTVLCQLLNQEISVIDTSNTSTTTVLVTLRQVVVDALSCLADDAGADPALAQARISAFGASCALVLYSAATQET